MGFAIGLMSGTSRDGVDAALIKTDGQQMVDPIAFHFHPYTADVKALIGDACNYATSCNRPHANQLIVETQTVLNDQHVLATRRLLEKAKLQESQIDIIGLHGHTVAHRADLGWTWQICDPAIIANELYIQVMSDMRRFDVMYGGQGAPLIPVFHRALFSDSVEAVAVLNLGGVANLTYLGVGGELIAFDCGMASALIDDWMSLNSNYDFDENGDFAAKGDVDEDVLQNMLSHNFFSSTFPKSLDRNDFDIRQVGHLLPANGAATLTAFSAKAVAMGIELFPSLPRRLIVCGGGRKNRTMLAMIEKYTGLPTVVSDDIGWNGDAIEAQGFAYLAFRCLHGLPITYPATTGVSEPMSGGILTKPERALRETVTA